MNTIRKTLIVAATGVLVATFAGASDAGQHGYDARVCHAGVHLRAAPCPTCDVLGPGTIPDPGTVHVYDTQSQPAGWAYGYVWFGSTAYHGYFPTYTYRC